jgi:hypothetical protein
VLLGLLRVESGGVERGERGGEREDVEVEGERGGEKTMVI